MCVCSLAQYMNTHIFWGAATAIFSQFADTKNFVALAALLMWIRIPFLPSATTLSPCSCLPAWFITSIVLRGKCILRIAFHCCQHLFLQAGSFPFSLCLRLPLLPLLPLLATYLPTYYSHSHRLSRGVKFVSPHTHTHTDLSCILTESNEACKGYIGVLLYKYSICKHVQICVITTTIVKDIECGTIKIIASEINLQEYKVLKRRLKWEMLKINNNKYSMPFNIIIIYL